MPTLKRHGLPLLERELPKRHKTTRFDKILKNDEIYLRNSQESWLLRLPPDARKLIWEYSFGHQTVSILENPERGQPGKPQLLYRKGVYDKEDTVPARGIPIVCKQFYEEARVAAWKTIRFFFDHTLDPEALEIFLQVHRNRLKLVKHIRLEHHVPIHGNDVYCPHRGLLKHLHLNIEGHMQDVYYSDTFDCTPYRLPFLRFPKLKTMELHLCLDRAFHHLEPPEDLMADRDDAWNNLRAAVRHFQPWENQLTKNSEIHFLPGDMLFHEEVAQRLSASGLQLRPYNK